MSLFARVAGIVLLFLPLSLSAKAAEPIRHHMEYKIRFSGIPLANASFDTEIGAQTATISGRFLSVGLANFFTRAEGENTVRGTIKNQRFWPETYESAYRSEKEKRKTRISFDKGNVIETSVVPARTTYPANWIKVTPEDLKSVTDPVSGLIISGKSPVCAGRRIQVYDGEIRMDLTLVSKGQKPFKTEGFDGQAEVCGVAFAAKAGYRAGRSDFAELQKSKRIEIWFARADKVDAYAPVYVQIPVGYGQLTVTATKFGS